MAYIKNITFWKYGRNDGKTCYKCGAYITNVYTVTYSDGLVADYGSECFDKLWKSGNLSSYGVKEFRKILKNIKDYNEIKRSWLNCKTEQELIEKPLTYSSNYLDRYNESEYVQNQYKYSAHKNDTFEEYKNYIVNQFIPYRLSTLEKELARFNRLDFKKILENI